MKVQYDESLSNFAFKFNLRHQTLAALVFSPFLPAVFAAGTDPRILKVWPAKNRSPCHSTHSSPSFHMLSNGRYCSHCSTHHPAHFKPSSLEIHGFISCDVARNVWQALPEGGAGARLLGRGGLPHAEHGRAAQVDPIKPTLKAPGTQGLKLKYDEVVSNLAFKFNLRR